MNNKLPTCDDKGVFTDDEDTCEGDRHPEVNLDFQRHVVNCESSRNFPTGQCETEPESGQSVTQSVQ
jgi:hypothetical protein